MSRAAGRSVRSCAVFAGLLVLTAGCGRKPLVEGSLVLAQRPVAAANGGMPAATGGAKGGTVATQASLFPEGSRIVLWEPGAAEGAERELSRGLFAAGQPVVSPDTRKVYFSGRATASSPWQVFEVDPRGGGARQLTSMPGGCMSPAVLAGGRIVVVSPAPSAATNGPASQLYLIDHASLPRQLTFAPGGVRDPEVLPDGRILFVASFSVDVAERGEALYTVINDGTEFAPFAGEHGVQLQLRRPRVLGDGGIGFLAIKGDDAAFWTAESVLLRRPDSSRSIIAGAEGLRCESLEGDGQGGMLATLPHRGSGGGREMKGTMSVFHRASGTSTNQTPWSLVHTSDRWDDVEAVALKARQEPKGHVSTMAPESKTGTLLCLDAGFSTYPALSGSGAEPVRKVRVLAATDAGTKVLGELVVQPDGSFMADVPADLPIGFETLSADGSVLRRSSPSFWVRSGENRTCVGCHAGHHRAPRNARPAAVNVPVVKLALEGAQPTATKAH